MDLENLQRSNEAGCLWPPIADALDTYLRRRATSAGPYERIWRLIHVWEAIAITLASAAICCVRETAPHAELFRRLRELSHGRFWKQLDKTFERQVGALQGSIDRWIDILFEICNYEYPYSPFLFALKRFMETPEISQKRLVSAWSVTCAAPADALKTEAVPVRQALRNLNVFRNRFAHVPFPHDPIEPLAEALEDLTEQLFSIAPLPWKIFPAREDNSPVVGGLLRGSSLLKGCGLFHTHPERPGTFITYEFPCPRSAHDDAPRDSWRADPYVHVDAMTRVYVLTRLTDEAIGTWEYTRFRAEANSVVTRDDPTLISFLPLPDIKEYAPEEAGEAEAEEEMTFQQAIEAIRNEDYDPAILFFEGLTRTRPDYHIGWLRLGHAKREKAMRLWEEAPEEALGLFQEAIDNLSRAIAHRDAGSRAQAYYERSKGHYHLARVHTTDGASRDAALADATEATTLDTNPRYRSWLEYLQRTYGILP